MARVELLPLDSTRQLVQGRGRHRVLAALGEGGMARVFLAVARGPSGFNKLCVLKALRPALAIDPDFLKMFLNEARLAARLNHPNIVQTYEVGEDAGLHVIVMEYLEGQSLAHVLTRAAARKTRMPMAMHVSILCDMLAGLHYAHEIEDYDGTKLGLVHRDVSPQNVFVTFDGQVKLLDFGIAKAVVPGAAITTRTGEIKGKVRYMAPEQMQGERVDRRADIFGVGALLWEAIAGEEIWGGVGDVAVMSKVAKGEMPPLPESPDAPERLRWICEKALAFDREARYQTAAEMETALEEVLESFGRVRPRDRGAFVSNLFSDLRAETRATIEAQLAKVASFAASSEEDASTSDAPVLTLPQLGGADEPGSPVGTQAPPASSGRSLAIVLALLVACVGGALLIAWPRGQPKPPPVATAPPSAIAPVPDGKVDLRVDVTPASAAVFLDGKPIPSNPWSDRVPRDPARHVVRAEAPGYVTRELSVTFDQAANLVLALEREPPPPAASSAPSPPHGGAKPHPQAAPKTPDCAQPFYVDERGIKKVKPECM
jgi:serine/threonine-protein kinase